MVVVVAVLAVTNAATLAALWLMLRRPPATETPDEYDAQVQAVLAARRPAGVITATRRVISIEVLNPIELAGTRGRVVGLVGSLVPGLTKRIVHDQVVAAVRKQLHDQHVVADVRLHTIRPAPVVAPAPPAPTRGSGTDADRTPPVVETPAEAPVTAESTAEVVVHDAEYVDEVEVLDMRDEPEDQPPVV